MSFDGVTKNKKILILDRNAHSIIGRQNYHSILALHIPVKLFELNSYMT